jgi:hypothetical protein
VNTLEIVEALHREAKLPGSAPSTIIDQSGRAADLAAWTIEAWNDIQRERAGQWNWLRRTFTLPLVANTASYAYGAATDVEAAAVISRFRGWDLNPREPVLIYLTADGQVSERELFPLPWPDFRYRYVRSTHTADYPNTVAVDTNRKLYFGPTPNDAYTVRGNYWRSNQTLALDADEPEMPEDYHMLIVYRAMLKYGYNAIAPDVLARVSKEGTDLYEALVNDQAYSRHSLSVAGPLA